MFKYGFLETLMNQHDTNCINAKSKNGIKSGYPLIAVIKIIKEKEVIP